MARTRVLAGLLVVLIPTLASADASNDRRDCAALIDKCTRYVGTSEYSGLAGKQFNDGDGRLAIAKCGAGDTATGIPILERRLRAAKVDLPPRG
jgi:hypothetical protein